MLECGICLAGGRHVPATRVIPELESLCETHAARFFPQYEHYDGKKFWPERELMTTTSVRPTLAQVRALEGDVMAKLDPEIIRQKLDSGETPVAIAAALGCAQSTVRLYHRSPS
jgi:hypothetical protein